MKRLAFIPARGGSKRLPRKNVIDFAGRPMLVHTVEAAQASGLFGAVVVSTDDPEIAAVARAAGAEVAKRPTELASDQATVNQALLAALATFEAEGRIWDELCCLYATAPLRTAEDIVAAHQLLDPPRVRFVISVTAYPFPAHQAMARDEGGFLRFLWPEIGAKRSSALPALVVDNGSTYWADTDAYRAQGSFFGEQLVGHKMPLQRSIDIDTAEQLEVALALKRHAEQKARAA